MRFIAKILLISGAIILVECTPKGSIGPKAPGETEYAVAQKKWKDVEMADLTTGHVIYATKCNTCHGLKEIGNYDEATWGKLIEAMAPKAKLNTEETEKLRKYIYSSREVNSK